MKKDLAADRQSLIKLQGDLPQPIPLSEGLGQPKQICKSCSWQSNLHDKSVASRFVQENKTGE